MVSVNLSGKRRRKRRKKVRRTSGQGNSSTGRAQGLDNVNGKKETRTPIDVHCPTSNSSPSMPSQGHVAMTNQYKVTTENSKLTPSATSACGFSQSTSGTNNVDLTTCS